jgi:hypothetical protein
VGGYSAQQRAAKQYMGRDRWADWTFLQFLLISMLANLYIYTYMPRIRIWRLGKETPL